MPHKDIEKQLKRYQNLYDMAPVGYFTINSSGLIVEMNLMGAKLLGVEKAAIVNHEFTNYISADDHEAYYLQRKALLTAGEPVTFEIRVKTAKGITFWSLLQCIIADDPVNGTVCRIAMSNISERKMVDQLLLESDEHIRRLNRSLEKRANELELSNQELESFSYSVSHDLRNPLNAITANIEVLSTELGNNIGKDAKIAIGFIMQSANRMAQVIADLMTLAGISRQKMKWEQVDISDIVRKIFIELQVAEPERKVVLDIESNLTIEGDPGLLRQLLSNLSRNAWKYTSQNVNTRIEFGKVRIGNKDCFYIRDNGIGFDMKHKKRLFKPFQRLHTEQEYRGSGIGLAIVKRVVEKHNGSVWGEGEEGIGSTFFFSI